MKFREWLCKHNWKMLEVLEKKSISRITMQEILVGKIFVQKCTKCGKLRHYELTV